jgi:protein-glutamine gamma-glutamyltransferase
VKFGLTHRILTSALAALGVLAIVFSGALPRISVILLLVGLGFAIFATERFQQSATARYAAAIIPSVLLGVEFLRLVSGAPLLDLAVEFAAALQIVRLATRRGAMHDQQVVLLALLHLVAGTVLGGGIAYGMCLFGFLLLAPGALVLSHLRREVEGNYRQGARDRTGLPVDVPRILRSRRVIGPGFLALTCVLSLPILFFTAILFILFPRVGLSLLLFQNQRAFRTTGFSDTVDLSGVGAIRSDPAIVLRFRPPSMPAPAPTKLVLRLRGTAFDEYKGGGQWSRSEHDRSILPRVGADVPLRRFPNLSTDSVYQFELEPIDPTVLFLPPGTVAIRWSTAGGGAPMRPPPVVRGPEDTIRYDSLADRVLRYDAIVGPEGGIFDETLSERDRARYVQLPKEMTPRLKELALAWTKGAHTDAQRAAMIEHHLESGYTYTLDAPSGGKSNPIEDFLFESKAGHCEFFSSAMALLLRAVEVPTRNVSGFVGGTYNRFGGFYAVRSGDAHSWVEVYVDEGGRHGWVTYDPTPASGAQPLVDQGGFWGMMRDMVEAVSQGWDRYVVGYDLPTQMSLFQRIQRNLEKARKQMGKPGASSSGPSRRTWYIGGAAFVILASGGYIWWRRRKRAGGDDAPAAKARQQRLATQLWLQVEEALQARGATRPRNVPPLRFAEQLRHERADVGEDVYELASRYALARFGGVALSPEEEREFERRIDVLRRGGGPADRDEALPSSGSP